MKKPKNKWKVDYMPWGVKKAVIRHFPTEGKARSFYKKLLRRSTPPTSQGIAEL